MKINEYFESIQGEGRYTGISMLFIRTSGCTRACSFCDTKYHTNGKTIKNEDVLKIIRETKQDIICFTGGEPLLQLEDIQDIQLDIPDKEIKKFHIETNGDLLDKDEIVWFDYWGVSPKIKEVAEKAQKIFSHYERDRYDIKIVTDLETTGLDMLPYATCLMPLTTYNKEKDFEIMKKVWQYCVEHKLRYSPRLQNLIYGKKKGV